MENKKYFYGNEISEEGVKNNRVDYRALAKSFDAVLCNDITRLFYSTIDGKYCEPEQVNGCIDNSEAIEELQREQDEPGEIFQYYIISSNGAQILEDHTDEIVYYLPALNMYVWGVTHYGTAWDYVLTDIKINENEA